VIVTDFARLLQTLAAGGVEYILIGGVAANAHGAIRTTRDIDIVYARSPANLERLEKTLAPLTPSLRGAPPGLPFRLDVATLRSGLNFTLTTALGELDLLGEVQGGGRYEDLLPDSDTLDLFGLSCRCLGLDALIRVKRAAGRPKDFEAVAELEALAEERLRLPPG
jgi:predicted nucleotidyltransferase